MPIAESDFDAIPDDLTDFEVESETFGEAPDWLTKNIEKTKSRFKRDKDAPRRVGRRRNLTEPLADQIVFAGTMLAFMRPITGIAVTDQAHDVAEALNEMAKTDDRLYRMLEKITTSGRYGKLVSATLPIAAAAYIETFPNSTGLLTVQASAIVERGLSDTAVNRIADLLEKKQQRAAQNQGLSVA